MTNKYYVVVRINIDNPSDYGLVYNDKVGVDVTDNFLYEKESEALRTIEDLSNRYSDEEIYKLAELKFKD